MTTEKLAETIGRMEREARRFLLDGDDFAASELRAEIRHAKALWTRQEAQRIARITPYHGTDDKGD